MKKDVVQKDSTNCVDRDADDAVNLSAGILWKINGVDTDDNFVDVEEVNIAVESSKTLSFHKRMKRFATLPTVEGTDEGPND